MYRSEKLSDKEVSTIEEALCFLSCRDFVEAANIIRRLLDDYQENSKEPIR